MKKIVGIFAHPDDESFGPSGTLALLAKENAVYLICVTNGDAAEGKPNSTLAEIRKEELESSAKIIGVKKVFFLNFSDGTLSNNIYHHVAESIQEVLDAIQPELIITIEPRGVSGHLDHIAVSMISSFVFQKVSYAKEIWYQCISDVRRNLIESYFVYFPPGYTKEEIDKTVDVSSVWEQKLQAIRQHESQKNDVASVLAAAEKLPKEEYFLVKKK
jgi:LmbE family N-acetylglucosaminyl deacetylase